MFSCENCEIYKNNYFDEIANEIQSGFKLVFQVFYHYGIYLYSLKIDISSWEFGWEAQGAVYARKDLLYMLKSQMWWNSLDHFY